MVIVINSGIDGFSWVDLVWFSDQRCPITTNCPITLSYQNCTEWLVENKAANAPITSGNCNSFDYDEYATVFSYSDYLYFHAW